MKESSWKRKESDRDTSKESAGDANDEGINDGNDSYGFVSFFREAVCRIKEKDGRACITKNMRKELGMEFKNLPPEKKSKYKIHKFSHDKPVAEETKFLTRCAPDRLAGVVAELTEEQREAVKAIGLGSLLNLKCGRLKRKLCCWLVERIDVSRCVIEVNGSEIELNSNNFGYIMGIGDGGLPVQLEGDKSKIEPYLDKLNATSSGINVKTLSDILHSSREADDEFKVTFMLFALCTVLYSPIGVNISSSILYSLIDANCIKKFSWATFCFERLIQGVTRYKEDNLAYVGGCVLYLQILYFNSVVYGGLRRDRSICPLDLWNVIEIKKIMKWIHKKGGYNSVKVSVRAIVSDKRTAGRAHHSPLDDGCNNPVLMEDSILVATRVEEVSGGGAHILQAGVATCEITPSTSLTVPVHGKEKHQQRRFKAGPMVPVSAATRVEDVSGGGAHALQAGVRTCEITPSTSITARPVNGREKHQQRRFKAGPFTVPVSLESNDVLLLEYIMDEGLDKRETIMQTTNSRLCRQSLLSLAPGQLIHSKIISILSEMLSDFEMTNCIDKCGYWFFPVLHVGNLMGDDPSTETWLRKCAKDPKDFLSCDRIVVPIHHGFAHWYLLVIVIPEMRAEIWDPSASSMTRNLFVMEVHRFLQCFDRVLGNMTSSTPFASFTVAHPTLLLRYHNPLDCGLYISLLMKQLHHRLKPSAEIHCDSEAERSTLILQLFHFGKNTVKQSVGDYAGIWRASKEATAFATEGDLQQQDNLPTAIATEGDLQQQQNNSPTAVAPEGDLQQKQENNRRRSKRLRLGQYKITSKRPRV